MDSASQNAGKGAAATSSSEGAPAGSAGCSCGSVMSTAACKCKDMFVAWCKQWEFSVRSRGFHKVPSIITVWFWILKILCTTVGEPIADYFRDSVLGLPNAFYVMGGVMLGVLIVQLFCVRYIAVLYWFLIIMIATTGTTLTDELTKPKYLHFSEAWTILIYFCLLGLVFLIWYLVERNLSIHSITTHRRETFYWIVVILTFGLGTALGDVLEILGLNFWQALLVYVGAIAVVFLAYYFLRVNATLSFWVAYVLTRPLGASLGDSMSKPEDEGGAGLQPGHTALIFMAIILLVILFLGISGHQMVDMAEEKRIAAGWHKEEEVAVAQDSSDGNAIIDIKPEDAGRTAENAPVSA